MKWISVKDELPEEYTNIITVLGGTVRTNIYRNSKGWASEDFCTSSMRDVTHWMPLPSPPEKDESES